MTANMQEYNVVVAVDTTYMNESFWSSITRDYLPFLVKSFTEMGVRVCLQFICLAQPSEGNEPIVKASPWISENTDDIRRFAESLPDRPCEFDIAEIFRYGVREADQRAIHGLVVFAATQTQRHKVRMFEHETKALAVRLKKLRVATFIFDNADEYNLVSSQISEKFGKAAMWADGLHVSFNSQNLRILYEYMKIVGPVVADDLAALKKQSGDLITIHGKHLFRKCILKISAHTPQ
jgi:hypothetical protein